MFFTSLAKLARDAGFPGGVPHAEAVAVMWAESRGDPAAVHVNPDGSRDRGVWQINDKWHPGCDDECAFDPVRASEYALKLWKESGFRLWTSYKNGKHLEFMLPARVALDGLDKWQRSEAAAASARLRAGELEDAVKTLETANATLKEDVLDLSRRNGELEDERLALIDRMVMAGGELEAIAKGLKGL